MKTARAWKEYYAREREALGKAGLQACLERAQTLVQSLPSEWPWQHPPGGAIIFPHTRLTESGDLIGAAALAAVASGAGEILALGVLHGARAEDVALVRRAREEGDEAARQTLRRVHGPGVPDDAGHWTEEFSLDNFCALVDAAAQRLGRKSPRVICRYPFLVGERPEDLRGMDELHEIVARGAAVVATADLIHYGVGYGDDPASHEPMAHAKSDQRGSFTTEELKARMTAHPTIARAMIERMRFLLTKQDYAAFQQITREYRSDFRDGGPTLFHLLPVENLRGGWVRAVKLVDYAEALHAPAPTWVAAALIDLGGR